MISWFLRIIRGILVSKRAARAGSCDFNRCAVCGRIWHAAVSTSNSPLFSAASAFTISDGTVAGAREKGSFCPNDEHHPTPERRPHLRYRCVAPSRWIQPARKCLQRRPYFYSAFIAKNRHSGARCRIGSARRTHSACDHPSTP